MADEKNDDGENGFDDVELHFFKGMTGTMEAYFWTEVLGEVVRKGGEGCLGHALNLGAVVADRLGLVIKNLMGLAGSYGVCPKHVQMCASEAFQDLYATMECERRLGGHKLPAEVKAAIEKVRARYKDPPTEEERADYERMMRESTGVGD
jgi:hypothetical protein